MARVEVEDNLFPAGEVDDPPLPGVLAVLMCLAAGVGHLHAVGAERIVAIEPESQLVDRRIDPDFVRDAQVLKLPRADELIVQPQTLLPIVRMLMRKLNRGIFVRGIDDPHRRFQ